jgi:hypothetical protein
MKLQTLETPRDPLRSTECCFISIVYLKMYSDLLSRVELVYEQDLVANHA